MVQVNPRFRAAPSGPLLDNGAEIRQYAFALSADSPAEPVIPVAPGLNVTWNTTPRLRRPKDDSIILVKWQVRIALSLWDDGPELTGRVDLSVDEGANWVVADTTPLVEFPALISASGTPDVLANQNVVYFNQAVYPVSSFASLGDTLIPRLNLNMNGASPAANLQTTGGQSYIEIYELSPNIAAP